MQDLTPPVGKRFEAEGPALVQRVKLGLLRTGRDDLRARRQRQMFALHLVDEGQLDVADGLERSAGAQFTLETGNPHAGTNNGVGQAWHMSNDAVNKKVPGLVSGGTGYRGHRMPTNGESHHNLGRWTRGRGPEPGAQPPPERGQPDQPANSPRASPRSRAALEDLRARFTADHAASMSISTRPADATDPDRASCSPASRESSSRSTIRADGIATSIAIAPIALSGQRAVILGQIMVELIINAYRHGLAGCASGALKVELRAGAIRRCWTLLAGRPRPARQRGAAVRICSVRNLPRRAGRDIRARSAQWLPGARVLPAQALKSGCTRQRCGRAAAHGHRTVSPRAHGGNARAYRP